MDNRIRLSRTGVGLAVLGALVVTFLVADVAWNAGVNRTPRASAGAPAAATGGRSAVAHLDLTILNDAGTGKWPAYVPSSFTLPAHSLVQVRIVDFDDATAVPAMYSKVSGTVGNTIVVQPIKDANPNRPTGPAATVQSLDPKDVGHTFTIPELGLNIPVAGQSITTFTIRTGAAGVYHWQCYDPCGTGAAGWTGPMAIPGYMQGTMTIAG